MMRKWMGAALAGIGLWAALAGAGTALAEVRVAASPESARVGENVDIRVEAEEGAESCTYLLKNGEKTVFKGEADAHFVSAFRPRQEGEYILEVQVAYADGSEETGSVSVPVSGRLEETQGPEVIYSQKDGWWKDKEYSKTELEKSGCAIFALSHALQRMDWKGEDITPEVLAETYRKCYTKNGTANARLIYQASQVYGYATKTALDKSAASLREGLRNGDLYSFGIVIGHIALMTGIDEDAKMVRVVDSAPSATFERIKKGKVYYRKGDGTYAKAADPGEIPGARYFFETGYYGGLEYYMDLSYCARRGGRLIRPSWLFHLEEGGRIGAEAVSIGIGDSVIEINGREMTVPTRELRWNGEDIPKFAAVTSKKNILLKNAEGKRIGTVASCAVLPLLAEEEDRLYVMDGDQRGYIRREDADVISAITGDIVKAQISVNGNTSGRAKVKMRFGPSEKHRVVDQWKTGTDVTVLARDGEFFQVEGRGLRVWVHQDFLTGDGLEAFASEEPAETDEADTGEEESMADESAEQDESDTEEEPQSDESAEPDETDPADDEEA